MLHQIDNQDAMLLMYLVGELPAEDHAEIERGLANDGAMRAALARVREISVGVAQWMEDADGQAGTSAAMEEVRRSAAVRRVSRAMVKQRVETPPPVAGSVDEAAPRALVPRWIRRVGIAAAIIGSLVVLVEWDGGGFFGESGRVRGGDDPQQRAAARETFVQSFQEETFGIDATDRTSLVFSTTAEDPAVMFQSE